MYKVSAAPFSLFELCRHIPGESALCSVLQALEDQDAAFPEARVVFLDPTSSRLSHHQICAVLLRLIPGQLNHLRSLNTQVIKVNPIPILRTALFCQDLGGMCSGPGVSPVYDDVVTTVAAIAWLEGLWNDVIPTINEAQTRAPKSRKVLYGLLGQVLVAGAESLSHFVASDRPDVRGWHKQLWIGTNPYCSFVAFHSEGSSTGVLGWGREVV